jgi:hypothetical protein
MRRTACSGTAPSWWKCEIAAGCEATVPGRPLLQPAHGGGSDSRAGGVVVVGAHRPAQTAARVGPAPGQRKVARLRRSERAARMRRTARRSTTPSRWGYEIAPGRGAAAQGRPLRRPVHSGGGDSRVGGVVVCGANRPARTEARVGPAPGQREVARFRRFKLGRTARMRRTARRGAAPSRRKCKIAPGARGSGLEHAVTNAETRHGSPSGNVQALPEECSMPGRRDPEQQSVKASPTGKTPVPKNRARHRPHMRILIAPGRPYGAGACGGGDSRVGDVVVVVARSTSQGDEPRADGAGPERCRVVP